MWRGDIPRGAAFSPNIPVTVYYTGTNFISRETGSAVPSRVSLLISILKLNFVPTYGIPLEFRGSVRLFI